MWPRYCSRIQRLAADSPMQQVPSSTAVAEPHICSSPRKMPSQAAQSCPHGERTSRNFARYTFNGSTYSSKPSVLIAHSRSSPFIVFRFSRWHLSLALSRRPHT